jgi:hypothetical protein
MPGTNQAGSRTYIRYRTVTSRRRQGRRRHSWNRFPATTSRLALPVRPAGRHRRLPSPYRFRRLPGMDRLNRPPAPRSRAADLPARSRGARHRAELITPRCCPVNRRAARQALEGVTMINSGRMLSAGEPLDGNERAGSWSGAATAAAFAYAVRSGRLDLPLPGSGWTRERWAALAALAEEDLSLARLAEGHSDADAILAELGASPLPVGTRWGVWAAQPPGPGLIATRIGHGWRLDGIKQYCSGARSCTDALVTGGGDGRPLRAWPRGGRRRLVRRIHLAIGGAVRRDRDVAGSGLLSASAQAVRLPRPVPSFTRSRGNATCLAGRKWAATNSPGGSARTSTRLPDPAAKPVLPAG